MTSEKMPRTRLIAVSIIAAAAVCLLAFGGFCIYRVVNTVTIGSVKYDRRISEINLSGSDVSSDFDVLLEMENLTNADLTNTNITPEQYDILAEKLPGCEIKWSIPLGSKTYSSNIQNLTLHEDVEPSELKNIRYFKKLKTLDARQYDLCDELYAATLAVSSSDCEYIFSGTLCGKDINSNTTELDLSSCEVSDTAEFYNKLRFFPDVTSVFVGDCKVSDEEMDKLNQAFPDTKIVWLVEFGIWQVRTDIKVFSTLVGTLQPKTFTQDDLYPLVNYCTDLVALDLGHNRISDISSFYKLTKLEILGLCNARITDISVLTKFPQLHYLELFGCTKLTDLSVLGELKNLEQLNIYGIYEFDNLKALSECTKLQYICAGHTTPQGDYKWNDLRKALPECTIDTAGHRDAVQGGWRNSKKSADIRTAFTHWKLIETYNNWDDVVYSQKVYREAQYS